MLSSVFLVAVWSAAALQDVAIGVTAVGAALGVVLKFGGRPFRFLWQQLFGDPIGEWMRDKVIKPVVDEALAPIKHELTTNAGTSIKDAVKRIEESQRKTHDDLLALQKKEKG